MSMDVLDLHSLMTVVDCFQMAVVGAEHSYQPAGLAAAKLLRQAVLAMWRAKERH